MVKTLVIFQNLTFSQWPAIFSGTLRNFKGTFIILSIYMNTMCVIKSNHFGHQIAYQNLREKPDKWKKHSVSIIVLVTFFGRNLSSSEFRNPKLPQ